MKFTKEQAADLTEEDGAENTNSDTSYRHGSYETYVVPFNGKFYQFTVSCHHEEGWDDFDDVDAVEVEKVEVITTKWKRVK